MVQENDVEEVNDALASWSIHVETDTGVTYSSIINLRDLRLYVNKYPDVINKEAVGVIQRIVLPVAFHKHQGLNIKLLYVRRREYGRYT